MTLCRAVMVALVLLFVAGDGAAQEEGGHPLDAVERAIAAHDYERARALLEEWRDDSAERPMDQRVRARFLEAVLEAEPDQAERMLLQIAVDHPSAAHAAEALLRVGQLRYAGGEFARALAIFERVIRDYPDADTRVTGTYWSVLSMLALQDPAGACGLLLALEPEASGRAHARVDHLGLRCRARSAAGTGRRATTTTTIAEPPLGPRYTIEAGRFEVVDDAIEVRDRLRAAGLDAHLLRLGGDARTLVRLDVTGERDALLAVVEQARRAGVEARLVPEAAP